MNIGTSILLYQIIWVVLFFMVLPCFNKHSSKSPIKPRILLKVSITTVLAFIGWGIAYAVITFAPFSFRQEKAPWMLPEKISFSPSYGMIKKLL